MTHSDAALDELVAAALAGGRRELARLISLLESQPGEAPRIMKQIYRWAGKAHTIGVTGAPGSGKSTLLSQIALAYRARGASVGIVAVDPSSPFSGGALLGDRVRMRELSGDPGIFVRSMSSRGNLGGLARSTSDVVTALDACGYERILIETVGAGQNDVAVSRMAHTTLLVLMPQMGDEIQTLKAGILESADVLAVNKADLEGADRAAHMLEAMLTLGAGARAKARVAGWRPPVISTIATAADGVDELVDAIERHREHLVESGELVGLLQTTLAARLEAIVADQITQDVQAAMHAQETQDLLARLARREIDPYEAAQAILRSLPAHSYD